jgi:glycosyltransferase involved in cell wall biosynthesis
VSVLFDVQGTQSPAHRDRGIARYLANLAQALERRPDSRVSRYLVDPELPLPPSVEALAAAGRIGPNDRVEASEASVYHIGSLYEPGVPLGRIWPFAARDLRLVVTVYDLIPEVFRAHYLGDPNLRQQYRARTQLITRADVVLAISETTARDVIRRLGVRPQRVHVVGAGVSEQFRLPASREAAYDSAHDAMPWLEREFILYTGGFDYRKNLDRLLQAYAVLPVSLRTRHQLVVVCRLTEAQRRLLEHRAFELGIADRVSLAGFVGDHELVLLYQSAHLFVFPSLYEGFGLPIAEAQACGAPVVASRSSSLVEVVRDEEALFNPFDPASIEAAVHRALLDEDLRGRLREAAPERPAWGEVAERTAAVYDQLVAMTPRRRAGRRLRVACITPLPPNPSGIADYSYRLAAELSRHCAVDLYFDDAFGKVSEPPGLSARPLRHFEVVDAATGGYDQVLYCLGNSEFHAAALDVLRRRPGVVLAHDVRLLGAYWWLSLQSGPLTKPRSFQTMLHSMYEDGLPDELGEHGGLTLEEAEKFRIYMAREAIAASDRFLVHSRYAAGLASGDAEERHREKVHVVPFACPPPEEFEQVGPTLRQTVVGTFGIVAPVKQLTKIVDAFAFVCRDSPDTLLAIVGPPVDSSEQERYARQAEDLGIGDRVRITGALHPERYRAWVASANVAVQLRAVTHGESAASIADCLAAGVPTIVTDVGSAAELPDSCVVKIARDATPEALGHVIQSLLNDDARRAALRTAALDYARAHSFETVAATLFQVLVEEARARGRALAA